MEEFNNKLEKSRLELLDMGLRGNSLLHFKNNAKSLEVVDEISSEIFRILVTEQRKMSFVPIPDSALDENNNIIGSQPLPKIFEEVYGDDRHSDTRLQTKLTADSLDKKLLKISTEAEVYYQEKGVDILYLALGFLNWYEDANSEKLRCAPLVLIPVALERSNASERFKVAFTQGELGANLTLATKLKMEFQIMLPEFDDELVFDEYLSQVKACISNRARWKVNSNQIALGFFSFGKFQMYQDLNSDNWPDDRKPFFHSVFQSLMGKGFNGDREGQCETNVIEKGGPTPDLTELHFVKDADSSQTEAVLKVKQGANLVIQGPPGTGKSQTITNIIAESVADGKSVLFVAEKMAALEVVKQRLDECQLGDAVLELHSHKSNKRLVLEELQRTLELGEPQPNDHASDKARHIQLRHKLDNYCQQVNSPVLASGISYIDALGYHLQLERELGDYVLPELDFSKFRDWNHEDFNEACVAVRELSNHLDEMGIPSQSPFALSTLEEFSPVEQNQITARLSNVLESLKTCQDASLDLAEEMGLTPPRTLLEINALCRAAKRALEAPHIEGVRLTTDDWQQRRDKIKSLINVGSDMSALRTKNQDVLIEQAWDADLLKARKVWATTGRHFWRFLSKDFRVAKQSLQGLLKINLPKRSEECIGIIDDILEYQSCLEKYDADEYLGKKLFGAQWQGRESDWIVLGTLSNWVVELYKDVGSGELPQGLLNFLEGGTRFSSLEHQFNLLTSFIETLPSSIENICQRLQSSISAAENQGVDDIDLESLETTVRDWLDQIDALYNMVRYNKLRTKLRSKGLEEIDAVAYDWQLPPQLLLVTLKKSWYEGLVNEAYRQHESIKHFDRISQEDMLKEFQRIDFELFQYAQESLVVKHHSQMPAVNAAGEMAIIRREMNKKRRHMPIRRLISQAGRAIQQIKPVFMMSPMSIATYLEQGALDFQLVVFDEASQVKVVDAMGAILRGKQVVVVGDTRQMPPTDFFGKAIELDDEEAEESLTSDIESILNMFLVQGSPETMLRWHYRSKHDSLIAVSNQEFYDGRLMIFPSPGVNPHAQGLRFNHLPETLYDRGGSKTNALEARSVAEAVMTHAKNTPQISLGVVAFSTAQRDCIILEVERMRRQDPSCEGFFTQGGLEGFFVKNLENVQGDERDVIFISIGYGRSAAGKMTSNFGPVNRDGGERRLNVLITRARLSMEVFSNFTADDLETKGSSPFGVRVLKNFLRYAETGELENRLETGKDTDSPFEDEVISAIQQLGYDVEPQVGSAGFYIDIAVKDPQKPGRYVLAVECDGASYHSSASARERDRLRQNVLEGLGWRFHRIWSTDWFRNPYKETQRLKDSIQSAISFYAEQDTVRALEDFEGVDTSPVQKRTKIVRSPAISPKGIDVDEYKLCAKCTNIPWLKEVHELPLGVIATALREVVEIEGAVHLKDGAKRIAESAGFARVGNRMLSHIEMAAKFGHKKGLFHFERDFLYLDSNKEVMVRNRNSLPTANKKIELVPDREIEEALKVTVETAFSLSADEAISEALSMMGFQRATNKARSRVNSVLSRLLKNNSFFEDGNILSRHNTNKFH